MLDAALAKLARSLTSLLGARRRRASAKGSLGTLRMLRRAGAAGSTDSSAKRGARTWSSVLFFRFLSCLRYHLDAGWVHGCLCIEKCFMSAQRRITSRWNGAARQGLAGAALAMLYCTHHCAYQPLRTAVLTRSLCAPGMHPWTLLRCGAAEGALSLAAGTLVAAPAADEPGRLPDRLYVALALYINAVLTSSPLKGALAAFDPGVRAQARSTLPPS